ncbi:hypothetical protein [Alkalisalibacterium limincola]|nr:hypothetical protein [Alkalisalibacterium limincola]
MRWISMMTAATLGAVLAGCGGSSQAVSVCEAAVAERLPGRTYQLDADALRASAREDGEGVVFLQAPLVIDPGMTIEQRQTVECRVRGSDIISLNFIW